MTSQVERLTRHIRLLKAQIAGLKAEPIEERPLWSLAFTPNETALLVALAAAHPRIVDRDYLEQEAVPMYDHVSDRDSKAVDVLVSKIRRKIQDSQLFPFEVVETHRGLGYRSSDLFARMAKLAAEVKDMKPSKRAA